MGRNTALIYLFTWHKVCYILLFTGLPPWSSIAGNAQWKPQHHGNLAARCRHRGNWSRDTIKLNNFNIVHVVHHIVTTKYSKYSSNKILTLTVFLPCILLLIDSVKKKMKVSKFNLFLFFQVCFLWSIIFKCNIITKN